MTKYFNYYSFIYLCIVVATKLQLKFLNNEKSYFKRTPLALLPWGYMDVQN